MKNYLFDLVSELEEWGNAPLAPFERKTFKLNSLVSIVTGIVSKDGEDVLVGFNDFINLLIDNDVDPGSITGVTLALACCEVTNKGDLGKVVCEGLVVDQGKIIDRSGEKFNLARGNNGYYYWTDLEKTIEYCNLEYVLSVILYSSVLYRHFADTIIMIFFKSFISSESDLIKIKNRLDLIRTKVDNFRKRAIH